MAKKGVEIRVGAKVRALEEASGGATRVVLADGSAIEADTVL